ncbi:MAG: PP2C family protein-serine/threonine phosphatase [Syntrophobacteraceae bacterium]
MEHLKECFKIAGVINSSLELDEVLELIMSSSRAVLKAEACSLLLADAATDELVFTVAQGPVADQLRDTYRVKKGSGIAGYVFETGEPLLIEDVYNDPRFHPGFDRRTGYRTRSMLCAPIQAKDRIVGVSQVINRQDGRPFTRENLETLLLLCSHAAVAIENARMHQALLQRQRMESDLAFARSIQLSFLPQQSPVIPGFCFEAHYEAAHEVGGDFYDFIPLDDERLGILIGDVSGKGVSSALYMARLTSDFRLLAIRHRDPAALVARVNDLLCERSCHGMFVTLCYLVLDVASRSLSYVNAGHIPPLRWNVLDPDRKVYWMREGGGPPTGILTGLSYGLGQCRLEPGDRLLLTTDGLTEAMNSQGERFGMERLERVLIDAGPSCEEARDAIVSAVEAFVGNNPQSDDLTLALMGCEAQP